MLSTNEGQLNLEGSKVYESFSETVHAIDQLHDWKNEDIEIISKKSQDIQKKFLSLPPPIQLRLHSDLLSYYQCCVKCLSEEKSLLDAASHIWFFFNLLKLRPPSDLFSTLESGDLVEVYDNTGLQVFRSFKLLSFTSYSLEDILVYRWDELFERDESITQQLISQAQTVLSSGDFSTQWNCVPDIHLVKEINSEEKRCFALRFKRIAPLKSDSPYFSHFLSSFEAKKIEI